MMQAATSRQIRRNMKITGTQDPYTALLSCKREVPQLSAGFPLLPWENGRYCIPVKAEYKGRVPGMVHDQSPQVLLIYRTYGVAKLNNDIRELELEEQKKD